MFQIPEYAGKSSSTRPSSSSSIHLPTYLFRQGKDALLRDTTFFSPKSAWLAGDLTFRCSSDSFAIDSFFRDLVQEGNFIGSHIPSCDVMRVGSLSFKVFVKKGDCI